MGTPWSGSEVIDRWSARYTVLALCLLAYFSVRFSQVIIGPLVPLIREEFAVSHGRIGVALTGMWIAYALSQLPSGVSADRFGEYRVVLTALGITIAAALLLAASPTFPVFAVAVIALGVGAGSYYNPATALLARTFDAVGGAIGTHRIGGQIAGGIAPIVAAAVGVRYGWRSAFALGAALAVVAGGLFLWRRPTHEPAHPDASLAELFSVRTLLEIVRRPRNRNTTFMMTLVNFVDLAAMAFLPAFLVARYGFSVGSASLLFGLFFATSAAFQPIGGRLSDRIGPDSTLTVLASAGFSGYAVLVVGNALPAALVGVVLAGAALSATPVLQARMMDSLRATNRGKGFGVFRTLYLLVGSVGTAIVGTAGDAVGWAAAFGFLGSLWGIVLLSVVSIRIVQR